MRIIQVITLAIFLMPTMVPAANTSKVLSKLGKCARTTIKVISQRLEDGRRHQSMPNSGSAMILANDVYGVSYDQVTALNESKVGDPVYTCLVKFPRNCPPGNHRGKI